MQDVPGFPSDLTVSSPSVRVLVDGAPVEFESVTVRSELESAMPEQVATGGGAVVAATGDVGLLSGGGVVRSGGNPWGLDVPANATAVVVEAGYGGSNAKQFTGVVDATSGAPSDPVVPARLIDGVDQLDRPITMEPLLNVWPSLTRGDYTWRRAGLSPIFVTDKILRHCGFYATPRLSGSTVFSATMMGSAWPEVGELRAGAAQSDSSASAAWRPTPWGVGLGNGNLTYNLDLAGTTGKLDSTFQMVFNLDLRQGSTGSPHWGVYWGNSALRVAFTGSGNIVVQIVSGGTTNALSMSQSVYGDSNTFNVRWLPSGNVTLYAENGMNVTTNITLPEVFLTTPMTHVRVYNPQTGHNLGGLWAGYSAYPAHSVPRTAHLTPPAFIYSLRGFPAVIERNCADLLKEQAEAELAAMWLDENGHFRWVNRNQLTGAEPVGTLTSEANLLDLPWETPSKSVYSRVEIIASIPTVTVRAWPNLILWQGSNTSLNDGDEDSQFIEPPAEETWFMVDPPTRASTTGAENIKAGRRSLISGIVTQDDAVDRWATTSEIVQTWNRINPQRWLLKTSAHVTGSQQVEMQILDHASYGKYAGDALPIIRGQGKFRQDETVFAGQTTGPANAPVLSHTVGPWIQDTAEIQALADWLAEQVTVTAPIIRDVPIVPDPRIQKGDVFWLEDTHAYGVRLKVLVMGISLTVSAGPPVSMEQLITCRIISAQRPWVTLGEHDSVWEGKSLNQQDTFWDGKTLNQHDANPLDH